MEKPSNKQKNEEVTGCVYLCPYCNRKLGKNERLIYKNADDEDSTASTRPIESPSPGVTNNKRPQIKDQNNLENHSIASSLSRGSAENISKIAKSKNQNLDTTGDGNKHGNNVSTEVLMRIHKDVEDMKKMITQHESLNQSMNKKFIENNVDLVDLVKGSLLIEIVILINLFFIFICLQRIFRCN